MNGRIALESMPGAGSAFDVTIPLPRAPDAEESAAAPPNLKGSNVLIVASNPVEASLVSRRLMRWGARTCVVLDAEVATAVLPERAWTALVVDHALGADTCARRAQASGAPTRIVLI